MSSDISKPIGARDAEQHYPGRIPWGECVFYFFTYPVALCFYACILAFVGTTLESTVGLPIANLPTFLIFFVPGAGFLLTQIVRDLHAHSRFDPNSITE